MPEGKKVCVFNPFGVGVEAVLHEGIWWVAPRNGPDGPLPLPAEVIKKLVKSARKAGLKITKDVHGAPDERAALGLRFPNLGRANNSLAPIAVSTVLRHGLGTLEDPDGIRMAEASRTVRGLSPKATESVGVRKLANQMAGRRRR